MTRTTGRILKANDVEIQGQFLLSAAPAADSEAGSSPAQAHSVPKQARILENHPDYAVIEVTCSCGTKMVLQCRYAGGQTPENPQMQNDTQPEPVSSRTK